ncbi:unnamed protein product [Schistocephalus solidus]|uniref:Uncharacterized protein n=1 Tax=Schistocephalus solidus TaxID=70667 RepID=A0A183SPZ7_SCHSO|nr:unnamed protein product [Schistocephalus solidus]
MEMSLGGFADREVKNHATWTLKKFPKQLQINPATWEDLAQERPVWRRSVKTGSAIYEANRIAASKAQQAARKSKAPRTNTVYAQHTRAVNASTTCESVWSDIFGRNASIIQRFQLLRQILPTLLQTCPPSPLASIPLLSPS